MVKTKNLTVSSSILLTSLDIRSNKRPAVNFNNVCLLRRSVWKNVQIRHYWFLPPALRYSWLNFETRVTKPLPNYLKRVKRATTQVPFWMSLRSVVVYVMVSVACFPVNCRLNNCLFLRFLCWWAGLHKIYGKIIILYRIDTCVQVCSD